ncbi:hypothetical protein GJ744_010800 [Endocarpon pusillum]|uniref:Mg2+ transporter protein, CorA-like/Zinc transport protein ZntB n=1 Tax=Endocarpon pusillum TaxID=364733 RepID=A0A8H7AG30_9EURO|nr:hypothetical protein GJ744_010800 [Endocarpon pusillum]
MPFSNENSVESEELHFFEAWVFDKDDIQVRDNSLPPAHFDDWLNLSGQYAKPNRKDGSTKPPNATLRLIFCPLSGDGPFKLGVGGQTYMSLENAFGLHFTTSNAILDNNGTFARYFFTDSSASSKLQHMALVLKVPNCINIGYHAISLSFDPKACITRAFLHGIRFSEWERLKTDFRSLPLSYAHPMLLPVLLFNAHQVNMHRYRARIDQKVYESSKEIGYGIPGRLQEASANKSRNKQYLDFEDITKRLHSYQTELATIGHVARFSKVCGEFLLKTLQELNGIPLTSCEHEFHKAGEPLLHRSEYYTNSCINLLSQSQGLKERVQSHINLTFSLIAQEENRINHSVAVDNAMIAVASKKDSSAMKTIALLTILFLPATFVATFFSMSIFDFSPSGGSRPVMSPYMWVYWTITIALTATVLLVWRIWWKVEDRNYQTRFEKAKVENEMRVSPIRVVAFGERDGEGPIRELGQASGISFRKPRQSFGQSQTADTGGNFTQV